MRKRGLALMMAAMCMLNTGCGANEDATENTTNESQTVNQTEEKVNDTLMRVPDGYLKVIEEKGTVTTITYDATLIDGSVITKTAYVYLPYGYDENKQYDIIYCLHGGEGDTKAYLGTDASPGNVKRMLDNMIANGDIKPIIAVAPTYYADRSESAAMGKAISRIEYFTENELVKELIPAVEGQFSTYAETTDLEGIKASREHRAYTGFSMGSLSTWYTFLNASDYFYYYMPMSGDCWINGGSNASGAARKLEQYCQDKGYDGDEFFIFAVTGSDDIAYAAMNSQIDNMKKISPTFRFTDDGSNEKNIVFMVEPKATHSFAFLPIYMYNGLQMFFK
ncbi:MAG: hypothetical protein IJP13_00630 [Lachnospiraceae bacterium]|nr:hypothetical protein [Lachnospiraceae bacterium]